MLKKIVILLLATLGTLATECFADLPEPPNPGGPPTGNDHPVGAPIDGGTGILVLLAGAYLAKKRLNKNPSGRNLSQ